MIILTLLIIVSSLAQAMILCKNVPIEYFPNDLGNDCFMRSFKPNILILLSNSDNECVGVWVKLAGWLYTIWADNLWQSGLWAISEWVKVHYYPNLYNCRHNLEKKPCARENHEFFGFMDVILLGTRSNNSGLFRMQCRYRTNNLNLIEYKRKHLFST